MSDTDTQSIAAEASDSSILTSIAMPLMLFSGVLASILVLSWTVVLPHFTQFDVSGVSLNPVEMALYTKQLKAQLSTMIDQRNQLVLPQMDPMYTTAKNIKASLPPVTDIRSALMSTAASVVRGTDSVTMSVLDVDSATDVVTVQGDVITKSPSSMTVLAAFSDAVEKLPFVSHLQRPVFSRTEDAAGLFHSPFELKFVYAKTE